MVFLRVEGHNAGFGGFKLGMLILHPTACSRRTWDMAEIQRKRQGEGDLLKAEALGFVFSDLGEGGKRRKRVIFMGNFQCTRC